MRAAAIGSISMMTKWRMTKSCRPLRGLDAYLRHIPGVPLTLHPRLYSAARIRGLDAYLRHIPGVPLTLHPRLYSAARIRGLRTRRNVGKDKGLFCRPHSRAGIRMVV